MGKFFFAFAWHIIVNLHVCICKNKICIWSDPGVNLPICKYTLVCICVRMRHLLTPSKICTPEYIYTCVFLAHANWTLFLPKTNLCFGAKVRKIGIPLHTSVMLYKSWGLGGYLLHRHVFLIYITRSDKL